MPVGMAGPRLEAAIQIAAAAGAAGAIAAAIDAASFGASARTALLALAGGLAAGWAALRMGDLKRAPRADADPAAERMGEAGAQPDLDQIAPLLEALPEPALLVDASGRISGSNAAARRRLEFEASGLRLSSILRHPGLLDAAQAAALDRVARAVEYATAGPVEEHIKCYVAPVALGRETAALLVFHDQTTMINTERMRVDFLANASHELRTPLASLTLLIETLTGHARHDPEAQDRFFALMQVQADRMRRLIDDLLSLSKIELNEHVPPADRVNLAALGREVADTLQPIAAGRGVSLQLRAERPEAWVMGDRYQLLQVAQNLVDNAIKYSARGGVVEIEVGFGETRDEAAARAGRRWDEAGRISLLSPPPAAGRRYAYLRVCDGGPGIARRHLPRLSERFYRVERDETSQRSGTGLGLAIVKHIISRHRGGFVVESVVGKGSAFAIYVEQPADIAALRPLAAPPAP